MFAFFTHKKFWLTGVILVLLAGTLEVALRLGIWDRMMHPRSFVKNAVSRIQAIEATGPETFHWISIGSSSFDWGVDHGALRQAMAKKQLGYARFGFESGAFMSMQTSTDWAIKHLPRLEGVIVGMPARYFGSFSDPTKMFKVSWPFLSEMDSRRYHYFHPLHRPFVWPFRTAIGIYGSDILDLLRHPIKRWQLLQKRPYPTTEEILSYNRTMSRNLCHLALDSLRACVTTAERLKKQETITGPERFITNVCGTPHARRRARLNQPMPGLNKQEFRQLVDNWVTFFQHMLDRGLHVRLVLMPEHSLMRYAVKNASADAVMAAVIDHFHNQQGFELIDLRDTFRNQSRFAECELFNEPIHYNDNGKALFTHTLLRALGLDHTNTDE